MKHKILKRLITLILIMIIIFMQAPTVHASLAGNAQSESGYMPPPPTPDDAPTTPIDPGPTDSIQTETKYYYETISGNVWEDLGFTLSGASDSNGIGKNKIPAKGIKVLLKQGGAVVNSTITDSSGNYSFSPPDGTYSTEFLYGDLTGINMQDASLVKSILKYNGHDYITVETPKQKDYLTVEGMEIIESGKGAEQVMIALDCSYGMRTTMVNVNGQTKSRLQIAADSAKQLINSLIDANENIYVGLVFFSGTSYLGEFLPTKDANLLSTALNEIVSNGWYTPNTNIVGALDKVKESFYNNDKNNSNRYMILISDGIPTSDGTTQVYCDESEQATLSKLNGTIGPNTKKKVQELRNDGINIISLIAKSDELDETQYVEGIFKDTSNIFTFIQDGQEAIDMITKNIKKYLIESTQEKEYSSGFTKYAGYEDANRRKVVDDNFKGKFTYKNTLMFQQIENYTSEELAKELSNKTWMRVIGGENYQINRKPADVPEVEEIKNEKGEVTKKIYHISTGYANQDLVIANKPIFSLATKTTATGLEIILADGSIFDLQTRDVGSDLPIIKAIDDELTHGATIRVEYTITIKNDSSMQCNYLELIDHLPPGFTYSGNLKLITENKKNSDYGFKEVSLQDLYNNGYISDETLNYARSRQSIKITLDNAGKGKDGFYIAPGGEHTLKFVTSKVISKLDDIEYMHDTIAEVLVYENSGNRRMQYKENVGSSLLIHGLYPGDSKDQDCSTYTNKVYIMPPTGANKNTIIKFTTIGLAIVLVGIMFTIKKESKKNRKHT